MFRETLRLYPTLPLLGRDATRTEQMRDKRTVKRGSLIFISPWLIQRHQKLWDRPDEFDPDRFSRPETKESVRCAYIPFSTGPRVCLGASFAMQEGVLILAYLVRHFEFKPAEGHTPEPLARLTLRAENGIRLHVHRRKAVAVAENVRTAERGAGARLPGALRARHRRSPHEAERNAGPRTRGSRITRLRRCASGLRSAS